MAKSVKNSIIITVFVAFVLVTAFACVMFDAGLSVAEASEQHGVYKITVSDGGTEFSSSKDNTVVYNAKPRIINVNIIYDGVEYDDYEVSYKNLDNGQTLDSPPVNVGEYKFTVKVGANTVEYKFEIKPSPLTLRIAGKHEYVYSGNSYGRTVSAIGVYESDALSVKVDVVYSYIDENGNKIDMAKGRLPVNAHNYTITYSLNNANYYIDKCDGDEPTRLDIAKKELVVRADDIVVAYGETPEYTITMSGFAPRDDESCIEVLPTVKGDYSEVGGYNIKPSGGKALNYEFIYQEGILTINALEASGLIEGTASELALKGVFAPNSTYTGSFIDIKSDEGKDVIKDIRTNRAFPSLSKAIAIYKINASNGGQRSEHISISISNVTLDAKKTYSVVSVSPSGIISTITKYTYVDGVLTFNAYNEGTFLIVENQKDLAIWAYIGIGAVVLIVLLMLGSKAQYIASKRAIAQEKRQKKRGKTGYRW